MSEEYGVMKMRVVIECGFTYRSVRFRVLGEGVRITAFSRICSFSVVTKQNRRHCKTHEMRCTHPSRQAAAAAAAAATTAYPPELPPGPEPEPVL